MQSTTRITTFVNLTPHPVSILLASSETLTIDPQPTPARVEQSHTIITCSDDDTQSGRTVEIAAPVYGDIIGLPAPVPTVAYICSVFVANAAAQQGRTDVLYPDSGPDAVRERGQVVAVRRLLAPCAAWRYIHSPEPSPTRREATMNTETKTHTPTLLHMTETELVSKATDAVTKAKDANVECAYVDIGLRAPLPRDGGPSMKYALEVLHGNGHPTARMDGRSGYVEIPIV